MVLCQHASDHSGYASRFHRHRPYRLENITATGRQDFQLPQHVFADLFRAPERKDVPRVAPATPEGQIPPEIPLEPGGIHLCTSDLHRVDRIQPGIDQVGDDDAGLGRAEHPPVVNPLRPAPCRHLAPSGSTRSAQSLSSRAKPRPISMASTPNGRGRRRRSPRAAGACHRPGWADRAR